MMMMSSSTNSSTTTTATNTTNNLPHIQAAPIPAPRTPKGREVARSNLENVANSATTTCENNVDQMSAKTTTTTTSEAVKCNKNDLSRLERILMASRNEDLNLAALISAVEKDIWYMEQLEQNPSVLRRKNSPDELPFPITDELLKLPGYKPKPRPPTLPPKERQRRHSDSVTTLTDSGVRRHSDLVPTLTTTDSGVITRVPYVEDEPIVPESRLRPKHNSVSNAIYQERLPSPTSVDTYNTDQALSENSYETDDLSDSTGTSQHPMKRLNCPLCIQTFGYSFGLECHLLSVHQNDLRKIRQGQLLLSQSCGCLCCAAQFLKLDTLVKHILDAHKDFLISSLHGKEFSDFQAMTTPSSSLKRHLECQFCGQKFLRRHQKLFLVHLEKCHIQELQQFMQESDMVLLNITQVENLEVKLLHTLSCKVRITSPDRSKRRSVSAQRVKHDELESTKKVLRFHESPPHHYEVIQSPTNNNIVNNNNKIMSTSTMQRLKKRLKRSESVGTKSIIKTTQYQKPDPGRITTGTPHIQKTRGRTYHHIPQPDPNSEEERTVSTYSSEESQGSSLNLPPDMPPPKCFSNKHMFKCNLCEIAFAENAFLLTHLKNKHRHSAVSKALKPQFSCGICPAKFFKNSFLVKHCESHELISDPQYYR